MKGIDARFVKYNRGHVPQYGDDLATKDYVDQHPTYLTPRLVRDADTVLGIDEQGLIIIANTQDVIIELPDLTEYTDPNHLHIYNIDKVGGSFDVFLKTQNGDTFIYGNTEFHLGKHLWSFIIHGSSKGFMLGRNITVDTKVSYGGTAWASTNFLTPTKIPMDTILHEDVSGLVDWRDATKDIEVLTDGNYEILYTINVESLTNVGEWSTLGLVYVNGAPVSELTVASSGYKAGLLTIVSASKSVELVSGDIVDLRLQSPDLAGQMNNAYFDIAIRL